MDYNVRMNYGDLNGKSVLLLGKTRSLNTEEFETLLKLHGIALCKVYEEGVALIIEGRMMNPLESQEAERLYEINAAPIVSLDPIEKWLCSSIEPNRLLMSLKLSRDQERLVDFIQNPYITDELFFKLLKLYDWKGEGFFDNDSNRDVTAAIIGRFYKDLARNHNVQYAMSGLAHLIERYGNGDLIRAIAELAPLSREIKHPQNSSLEGVLDAIALHPDTPEPILRALMAQRSELLVHRVPLSLEVELVKEEKLHPLLAQNESLSYEGALLLEAKQGPILAAHIGLNNERFDRFFTAYPVELASNPTLTEIMQEKLMGMENKEVYCALASNAGLGSQWCRYLYDLGEYSTQLAANPSLPCDLLEKLYQSGNPAVLGAIASNPATSIDILYQLSLDRRYERSVKTNPTFGNHIQTHNIGWQS
jgi:hypothetical protein